MLIGIDPGIKGAIAFLYDNGRTVVLDMPVRRKAQGKGNEIAPKSLQQMFRNYVPADEKGLVVMESQHAFMGSGETRRGSMSSQASLAATKAVIAAICELAGMDIAYVTPKAWQSFYSIRATTGETTKQQSLRIARELFGVELCPLQKHDGRADSLLIARYAQCNFT